MERTTIFVSSELRRRLADEARRQGRHQAELVREALEEYLNGRKPERPHSVGIVSRGDLDAANAKAWVRRQWARDAARGKRKPASRRAKTGR